MRLVRLVSSSLLLVLAGVVPVRAEARDERPAESVGMSAAGLARVDSLLMRAVRDGATPGAALAVARGGQLVRLRGYGHLSWDPLSAAVTDSTLYDLASLTKAVGTTTAALMLVKEGKLDLTAPVSRYLGYWPKAGKHGKVQIHHLLHHTSGLPAGIALWTKGGTRDSRLAQLAKLPVRTEPGAQREYSDVGMILLGAVLEKVSGQRLDDLLEERVFRPLNLRETGFTPLRRLDAPYTVKGADPLTVATSTAAAAAVRKLYATTRIAPTEYDPNRRGSLQGVVHDQNAAALSGVAGHAGLFSSARDLAVLVQDLMDASMGKSTTLFPDGDLGKLLDDGHGSSRPLGWDIPTGTRSSSGNFFSPGSFGHTGFTGTSIWIDPQQELFVILLTNRLHPSARNQKHVALRREVHDAVQLAIVRSPAPILVADEDTAAAAPSESRSNHENSPTNLPDIRAVAFAGAVPWRRIFQRIIGV